MYGMTSCSHAQTFRPRSGLPEDRRAMRRRPGFKCSTHHSQSFLSLYLTRFVSQRKPKFKHCIFTLCLLFISVQWTRDLVALVLPVVFVSEEETTWTWTEMLCFGYWRLFHWAIFNSQKQFSIFNIKTSLHFPYISLIIHIHVFIQFQIKYPRCSPNTSYPSGTKVNFKMQYFSVL